MYDYCHNCTACCLARRTYTHAVFDSAPPLMTPVSGQWTFGPVTTLISTSSKQVFSNVTHSFASLDPAFHASPVNVGTVLLDVPGPYLGTLTLDTTTLSNGVHKLFLLHKGPENIQSKPRMGKG